MNTNDKHHTGLPLTHEERLRRKAESGDPIPIRLTNNYAFHRVFKKPEVCKGFLTALLHISEADIRTIEIADPFKEGESASQKEGILDIQIRLNNDQKINIEMQASRAPGWGERSLFYLCRVYTEDLKQGEDYRQLAACIHVGILDFSLLSSPGFHHHIQLLDTQTHELYSDKFQIHVIELSKLNDPYPQEDEELYHWAKMLAAENLEVMQMQVQDDSSRQAAFDELKYISLNPTERYLYLREFLAAMDQRTLINYYREEGFTEGQTKGELTLTLQLLQKKIRKGCTLAESADALEDTEEHLAPLYQAVKEHPELSASDLAKLLMKDK